MKFDLHTNVILYYLKKIYSTFFKNGFEFFSGFVLVYLHLEPNLSEGFSAQPSVLVRAVPLAVAELETLHENISNEKIG